MSLLNEPIIPDGENPIIPDDDPAKKNKKYDMSQIKQGAQEYNFQGTNYRPQQVQPTTKPTTQSTQKPNPSPTPQQHNPWFSGAVEKMKEAANNKPTPQQQNTAKTSNFDPRLTQTLKPQPKPDVNQYTKLPPVEKPEQLPSDQTGANYRVNGMTEANTKQQFEAIKNDPERIAEYEKQQQAPYDDMAMIIDQFGDDQKAFDMSVKTLMSKYKMSDKDAEAFVNSYHARYAYRNNFAEINKNLFPAFEKSNGDVKAFATEGFKYLSDQGYNEDQAAQILEMSFNEFDSNKNLKDWKPGEDWKPYNGTYLSRMDQSISSIKNDTKSQWGAKKGNTDNVTTADLIELSKVVPGLADPNALSSNELAKMYAYKKVDGKLKASQYLKNNYGFSSELLDLLDLNYSDIDAKIDKLAIDKNLSRMSPLEANQYLIQEEKKRLESGSLGNWGNYKEYERLELAEKKLNQSIDYLKAPGQGDNDWIIEDVVQAIVDQGPDVIAKTITLGWSGAAEGYLQNQIINNGLSPDAKASDKVALLTLMTANDIKNSRLNPVSLPYSITGGVLQSVPFMAEMYSYTLGMGEVSSAFKLGTKEFVTRFLIERGLQKTSYAVKILPPVVGGLSEGFMKASVLTLGTGNVGEAYWTRQAESKIKFTTPTVNKETGEVTYTCDMSKVEPVSVSLRASVGDTFNEFFSEQLGDATKLPGMFKRTAKTVNKLKTPGTLLAEMTSFHGFGGEMFEEYYNALTTPILTGQAPDSEFWTDRGQFELMASIAVQSAGFKLIGAPATISNAKNRKNFNAANAKLDLTFGQNANELRSILSLPTIGSQKTALVELGYLNVDGSVDPTSTTQFKVGNKITSVEQAEALYSMVNSSMNYAASRAVLTDEMMSNSANFANKQSGNVEIVEMEAGGPKHYKLSQSFNSALVINAETGQSQWVPIGEVRPLQVMSVEDFAAAQADQVTTETEAQVQAEAQAQAQTQAEQASTAPVYAPKLRDRHTINGEEYYVDQIGDGNVLLNPVENTDGTKPPVTMTEKELSDMVVGEQQPANTEGETVNTDGSDVITEGDAVNTEAAQVTTEDQQPVAQQPVVRQLRSVDGKSNTEFTIGADKVAKSNKTFMSRKEADKVIASLADVYEGSLVFSYENIKDPNDPFSPNEFRIIATPVQQQVEQPVAEQPVSEQQPEQVAGQPVVEAPVAEQEQIQEQPKVEQPAAETLTPTAENLDTTAETLTPASEADTREPWEMTRDEFIKSKLGENWEQDARVGGINQIAWMNLDDIHSLSVQDAVSSGKNVSEEVLKDYPSVAKTIDTSTPEQIDDQEAITNTNPTDKQKVAGNYKKGTIRIQGLTIRIETPKGEVRSGIDEDGNEWRVTMNNTYGYFSRGKKGRDGDQVDVFVGDNPKSKNVYVIDQLNSDGKFDEHKVMLGFDSAEEALEAYNSNYSPGWKGAGAITEMDIDTFKGWLGDAKRSNVPLAWHPEFNSSQDWIDYVLEYSANPNDIYNAWEQSIGDIPYNQMLPWQQAIIDGGIRTTEKSFGEALDPRYVTQYLRLRFFRNGASTLDNIAQELGMDGDITSMTQIAEFMLEVSKGGMKTAARPEVISALSKKLRTVTGMWPSQFAKYAANKNGVEILTDFFSKFGADNSMSFFEQLDSIKHKLTRDRYEFIRSFIAEIETGRITSATAVPSSDTENTSDTERSEENSGIQENGSDSQETENLDFDPTTPFRATDSLSPQSKERVEQIEKELASARVRLKNAMRERDAKEKELQDRVNLFGVDDTGDKNQLGLFGKEEVKADTSSKNFQVAMAPYHSRVKDANDYITQLEKVRDKIIRTDGNNLTLFRAGAIENILNDAAQQIAWHDACLARAQRVGSKFGVKIKAISNIDSHSQRNKAAILEAIKKDPTFRPSGYFDRDTDTVIIMPSMVWSLTEIGNLVVHETVGHKGLRVLMGDEFEPTMLRVYNKMTAEQRADIVRKNKGLYGINEGPTEENPDERIPADSEEVKREKMITIADEFMAYSFEKFGAPNWVQKIWEEIKALIRKLLRNENISLSNNAIRVLAEKSRQSLIRSAADRAATMPSDSGVTPFSMAGAEAIRNMDNALMVSDDLEIAVEMQNGGSTPAQIKCATNWEMGPDGKWFYEFSDVDFKVKEDATNILEGLNLGIIDPTSTPKPIMLSDIIDAPEHMKLYPQLAGITVEIETKPSTAASYSATTKVITINIEAVRQGLLRTALLHETQHAIQHIEGFATGANFSTRDVTARMLSDQMNDIKNKIGRAERKLSYSDRAEIVESLTRQLNATKAQWNKLTRMSARDAYLSSLGEVNARNVQFRDKMRNDQIKKLIDEGKSPQEAVKITEDRMREIPFSVSQEMYGMQFPVASKDVIYLGEVISTGLLAAETQNTINPSQTVYTPKIDKPINLSEIDRYNNGSNEIFLNRKDGEKKFEYVINMPTGQLLARYANFFPINQSIVYQEYNYYKHYEKHKVPHTELKDLAKYIQDPLALVKTESGDVKIITDIIAYDNENKTKGLMVVVVRQGVIDGVNANVIVSHHVKGANLIKNNEDLMYVAADKARRSKLAHWNNQSQKIRSDKKTPNGLTFTEPNTTKIIREFNNNNSYKKINYKLTRDEDNTTPKQLSDAGLLSFRKAEPMPETINVDGVERPTRNSAGEIIHTSEDGIRNFWNWFGDSKVVDEQGRPLVVYHGTNIKDINEFYNGWFSEQKDVAVDFGQYIYPSYLKIENPIDDSDMEEIYKRVTGSEYDDMENSFALRDWIVSQANSYTVPDAIVGYDGVITYDDSNGIDAMAYVPFASNQIKSATENTGSFSPSNSDIRFRKAEPMPETINVDGVERPTKTSKGTPIFGSERGIANFWRWFGNSKVVDDAGRPIVNYSGHSNISLYGDKFDPKKSTAGGFYATEDPQVASGYALSKFGSKEGYENGSQYRLKGKNGKFNKKLWQVELTEEQQRKMDELENMTDKYGEYVYEIHGMREWAKDMRQYEPLARRLLYQPYNLQNIWEFNENMGYNIAYDKQRTDANEPHFLLQQKNETERLMDALGIEWNSYEWDYPEIMPVFLSIRKPLDADYDFPQDVLDALKQAAKGEHTRSMDEVSYSTWTKDYPLKEFIADIERGSEGWTTQVPKKALPIFKRFGYDGIKERGQKGSDAPREERHINWIAFDPTQIKSATGNNGNFDPGKPEIMFRAAGENPLYVSTVESALGKIKQDKGLPGQWKAMLMNSGAKPAELEWMGWDDFVQSTENKFDDASNNVKVIPKSVGDRTLYSVNVDGDHKQSFFEKSQAEEYARRWDKNDKTISRHEIQKWIDDNRVEIKEVEKGEKRSRRGLKMVRIADFQYNVIDEETNEIVLEKVSQSKASDFIDGEWSGDDTKYKEYKIPGGDNYKEMLLTLPSKDQFNPLNVEIKRNIRSATQGNADIYYNGKLIGSFEDNPVQRGAEYVQTSDEVWMDVAKKLFYGGAVNSGISPISKNTFKSGHWDEPNILAHVRFDERKDSNDNKVLFLEEVQSDWAQKGKKEGFDDHYKKEDVKPLSEETIISRGFNPSDNNLFWYFDVPGNTLKISKKKYPKQEDALNYVLNEKKIRPDSVPDMPYKKTDQWAGLVMRRMMRYAADNGFDKIAWTTGEQQAERYDLSNVVDRIATKFYPGNTYTVIGYSNDASIFEHNNVLEDKLDEYVGKELAKQIVEKHASQKIDFIPGSIEKYNEIKDDLIKKYEAVDSRELERILRHPLNENSEDFKNYFTLLKNADREFEAMHMGQWENFTGQQLKVGGEGMKAFYDNIIPSIANKIGKKFGAQVQPVNLPEVGQVQSIPITEPMKESVMSGVPLFRAADTPRIPKNQKVVRGAGNKLRMKFADRMQPIKLFQNEILRRGGKIDSFSNAYDQENKSRSRAAARIEKLRDKYLDPIEKIVADIMRKNRSLKQEDVEKYLIAKHAPERNDYYRTKENDPDRIYAGGIILPKDHPIRINYFERQMANRVDQQTSPEAYLELEKELNDKLDFDGVPLTDEVANQIAAEYEALFGKETADKLTDAVRKMNREILDLYLEYGAINDKQHEELSTRWNNYVPLRGWREDGKDIFDWQQSHGGNMNMLKSAEGRISEADSPLAYMENMLMSAIVWGEDNKVKRSFLTMARNNMEFKEGLFDMKKVWYITTDAIDEETGKNKVIETTVKPPQELFDAGMVSTSATSDYRAHLPASLAGQREIEVVENGEKYKVITNDPAVANAINHNNDMWQDVSRVSQRTIGQVTRFMSSLMTSKNPAFIIPNLTRDFSYAWISNAANAQGTSFVLNMRRASGAIVRAMKGKSHPEKWDGKSRNKYYYDKLYDDFIMGGGRTGFLRSMELDKIKAQIERDISLLSRPMKPRNAARHTVRFLNSTLDYMAGWSEDMSRFATYIAAIRTGKSESEAIKAAKDVTVNFDRKGQLTSFMGAMYAFFNPAVQGGMNFMGLLKKNRVAITTAGLSFFALGYIMGMLNRLFGGDDDEFGSYYEALNPYLRKNYLIIPTFWDSTDKKFISIPLPPVFRSFYGWGEQLHDVMNGDESVESYVAGGLSDLVNSFSPFEPSQLVTKDGGVTVRPLIPTAFQPIFDVFVSGKDFAGNDIAMTGYTKKANELTPASMQSKKGTGELYQWMADRWFQVGGGDPKKKTLLDISETGEVSKVPKIFDINPSNIEYLLESYTGGRGQFFNQVAKTTAAIYDGAVAYSKGEQDGVFDEVNANMIPVLNRFIRQPWKSPYVSQYYELMKRADEIENYINASFDAWYEENKESYPELDPENRKDKATLRTHFEADNNIAINPSFLDDMKEGRKQLKEVDDEAQRLEIMKQLSDTYYNEIIKQKKP